MVDVGSEEDILTKTWVEATLRQAHRYDVARRADSLFVGSMLELGRADLHYIYKDLSYLAESNSFAVTNVI